MGLGELGQVEQFATVPQHLAVEADSQLGLPERLVVVGSSELPEGHLVEGKTLGGPVLEVGLVELSLGEVLVDEVVGVALFGELVKHQELALLEELRALVDATEDQNGLEGLPNRPAVGPVVEVAAVVDVEDDVCRGHDVLEDILGLRNFAQKLTVDLLAIIGDEAELHHGQMQVHHGNPNEVRVDVAEVDGLESAHVKAHGLVVVALRLKPLATLDAEDVAQATVARVVLSDGFGLRLGLGEPAGHLGGGEALRVAGAVEDEVHDHDRPVTGVASELEFLVDRLAEGDQALRVVPLQVLRLDPSQHGVGDPGFRAVDAGARHVACNRVSEGFNEKVVSGGVAHVASFGCLLNKS